MASSREVILGSRDFDLEDFFLYVSDNKSLTTRLPISNVNGWIPMRLQGGTEGEMTFEKLDSFAVDDADSVFEFRVVAEELCECYAFWTWRRGSLCSCLLRHSVNLLPKNR